jgi:uncharacterized protein with ATP-grasp and redox domains
MKTYLECVPCFFSQTVEACRMLGLNEDAAKGILDEVARVLPGFALSTPPPEMSRHIHAVIRERSGRTDPYEELKRKSNEAALAAYPRVKRDVRRAVDPLRASAEAAIAGNIIDYGAVRDVDLEREIGSILKPEKRREEDGNLRLSAFTDLERELSRAKTLLYLADNAGEIVFDRIFIEEIKSFNPGIEISVAVRGAPIINDCLEADARFCGLHVLSRIVSNGSDAPGTLLSLCSPELRDLWKRSDLVIGKGQGNYESLSGEVKNIFFLLKAKCPVVARNVGARVRDAVLLRGGAASRH